LNYGLLIRLVSKITQKEKHTPRTFKINPIIAAVTSVSMNCNNEFNHLFSAKNEKLHQFYIVVASSCFFVVILKEINSQMALLGLLSAHLGEN
jgi:hypothetical protein